MKKKMKSKLIAAVMSLAMAFTMMPMLGAPAYADDPTPPAPASICLVQDGEAPDIAGGQQSSIWFGRYLQSSNGSGGFNVDPVKWRVLSNDHDNGRLFLLSDMGLDCAQYNDDHLATTWKECTIRTWLNDKESDNSFIKAAFSENEQTAIAITDVDNPGYVTPGDHSTKDQIFLLSTGEAMNENYGFSGSKQNSETREVDNTDYTKSKNVVQGGNGKGYWWLRSPGTEAANQAAVVQEDGYVNELGYTFDSRVSVRPVFNLDLGSVLFISTSEGGKPSTTGPNSLTETGENTSDEWKLTMTDEAHQDFRVTSVRTYDGKTLYIKYTKAATGDNEYISALIKTSDGKIKSYGRIASASDEEGATVLLNIDGKMSEGDTLCIFNEQCNDDRQTDYTSPLQEISIPDPEVTDDAVNLVDKDGIVPGIIPSQGSSIYFGKYKQESIDGARYDKKPIKWRVLWDDDAKGQLYLLSDRNLDCKKYNDGFKSTTWENGPLRAWLNSKDSDSFINEAFSGDEQTAIATTRVRNKKADDYTPNPERPNMDGGNDTDDQVFLLSFSDVMNVNYGFTNDYEADKSRVALNTEYAQAVGGAWTGTDSSGIWWLRSPGYGGEYAATIAPNGRIIPGGIEGDRDEISVRPALNLNKSYILFISSAQGGRTSVIGPDALVDPGKNTSNEWKATVKDSAHQDFKVVSVTTCDSKMLDIKYSDAVDGDGEYITAIIKTSAGRVKYIGNLAAVDNSSGIVHVNIHGKMDEGDTLCVFNRRINGNGETDFSSPMHEIEIPTTYHDLTKTDKVEPTCTESGREEFWTCEICEEKFSDKAGQTKITEPKKISATGHKYGDWTKLDATQHQRVCEHDGNHVEKENHKWDAGKVTMKATTITTGVKAHTCTACKATKTEAIPKLAKKTNPLKVKGKTAKVKYKKLKKKKQTLAVGKVIKFTKKGQGKMSYKKNAVTYTKAKSVKMSKKALKKYKKKAAKRITINTKTGKITLKKGLKKGTYKVKVKVKAAGNTSYKASSWKTVKFKIKVK